MKWRQVLRNNQSSVGKEEVADRQQVADSQEVMCKEEVADRKEGHSSEELQIDHRFQELHQVKRSLKEMEIISRHQINLSLCQILKQGGIKEIERRPSATKTHNK